MNLSWIDKVKKHMPEPSSAKELRSFGFIVAGGFVAIDILPLLFRGHHLRAWPLIVAGVFLLPALAAPAALKHPYRVWMLAGHCLGWVNTRIILTILFYVVFTPVSVMMRFLKRDTMNRTFDAGLDTYRIVKSARPASHLKHQF
jgi:hypothetical protein